MANTAHLRTMFGIKLSRLRDARRLTLSALAGQAGVSVSYLAEIEAGKKFPGRRSCSVWRTLWA